MPDTSDEADTLRAALGALPADVLDLVHYDILKGRHKLPTVELCEDRPSKPPELHRTELEREELLAEAAVLDRMGFTQSSIAKKLGVTQPTVSSWLKETKARYNATILEARQEIAARELATLMDVRRVAYQGLERARQGLKRTRRDESVGDKGRTILDSESNEELLPPVQYLNTIIKTNERICDMLGLDQAIKVQVNAGAVLTSEALLGAVLGRAASPGSVRVAELEAAESA